MPSVPRRYNRDWMWHRKERKRLEQIRTVYLMTLSCLIILCIALALVGVDVATLLANAPEYADKFIRMIAEAWR